MHGSGETKIAILKRKKNRKGSSEHVTPKEITWREGTRWNDATGDKSLK